MGEPSLSMLKALQRYAEGICRHHRLSQIADLETLKGMPLTAFNAERIRELVSSLQGVSTALLDTEWDSVLCTILRIRIAVSSGSSAELRLDVRLSKIAPIATCRWIEIGQRELGPDTRINVGRRFEGVLPR